MFYLLLAAEAASTPVKNNNMQWIMIALVGVFCIISPIVFGLLSYKLAKTKNNITPIGGFLLGFFLGVIGLIIVVAIQGNQNYQNADSNPIQPKAYWKCPSCKNKYDRDTLYCPKCGQKFDISYIISNNKWECHNCGTLNEADSNFCKSCGSAKNAESGFNENE